MRIRRRHYEAKIWSMNVFCQLHAWLVISVLEIVFRVRSLGQVQYRSFR